MKKNLFMVAAVALMALISCNKEEMNNGGNAQAPEAPKPSYYVEFTADIPAEEVASAPAPQSAATRTAYDATNKKTKWVAGDLISVNGKKFKIADGGLSANGYSARFINAEELGEDFNPPYTAIYPYNANKGQAVVPTTQTVSNGTFPDEAVVAVGYSANNTLSFKHVCSIVKFTVSTSGLTELEFSSANDIAGTINVSANAGAEPTYSVKSGSGSQTITVKPANGTFSTSGTYYVSVLPTLGAAEDKQSFEIKSEGVVVKSGNVRFKRNVVMDAKAITVNYTYLKPNQNWKADGARFAAYYFIDEDTNAWADCTDSDGDGLYRAVIPEGFSNIIFCRMNGDKSNPANVWENKWDQTNDQTVSKDKCYVVHIEEWSNGAGGWFSLTDAKKILYLLPTAEWDKDNARFAAYFFDSGTTWKSMTRFATNKYYVVKPGNHPKVIFCRMNGANATNDWNNKWNQTVDLTVPTNGNNTCTISNFWANGGASGTWSLK